MENRKLKMVKQQNLPALPLLGANGFDVLAANAKLDAERWAQIRALHDRASYDGARSRKSRGLGRIENRVITRIADHRMLGSVEAVVVSQLGEIGDVLELAIAERRVRRKRPVAAGSRSGAAREPHQNAGHVFAAEAVANEKLLRGPGLGHFLDSGDAGSVVGGVRRQSARVGRGRWHIDLRQLGGFGVGVAGTERPARSQEHGDKNNNDSDNELERRVGRGRTSVVRGDAWNFRNLRLETVRWGRIGHRSL